MSGHLSAQQMKSYLEKRLQPGELIEIDEHLSACMDCRTALQGNSATIVGSLQREFSGALQPHLTYEQLVEMVQNKTMIDHNSGPAHLESCSRCKAEYYDLLAFAADKKSHTRRTIAPWLAAAAVLLAIALIAGLRFKGQQEKPAEQTQRIPARVPVIVSIQDAGTRLVLDQNGNLEGLNAPPEYEEAVRLALQKGEISVPRSVDSLLPTQGVVRSDSQQGVSFPLLEPVGTVVMSDRPVFEWQQLESATKYRVTVLDLDMKIGADSGWIQQPRWQPTTPLQRGKTYTWQVAAFRKGSEVVSPAPPAGEARFQILDDAAYVKLQKEQQQYLSSRLLLALRYAHHGLLDDAENNLRELMKYNPGSREIQRLLDQLQNRR